MDGFRRDGMVFDVRDGGPPDGEPVVLLHGFPQDATAWAASAAGLHAAGLRTLAPDQRGYSPSARPTGRSAYRVRELTADVLALLDEAGLDSAHVVGHDWGGIVGWALAAWHPERVRTLTALSVPHPAAMVRAMLTSDQALRSYYVGLFQLPFLPERLLLVGGGEPLRRMFLRSDLPRDVCEHYVARMQEPGALSAALAWYRALPLSAHETIGTVRVPTLHLWSTGDAFLGRAATEATRDFVDAPYRLEVLEGVPHWIPELAPERVAELVTEHVRAHG
ncbi:alpha/beta fold hydrolase [Geodermatophilus sabuli]|uniref:Pimeloyl-ACP methyl ester carboxylesterase n=1 Tax=Geodermatophilus sabuli TaxID=1564158 RepID=A0A285E5L3_9ACTN|nr:alpha/beta fold hydrolase [Geodermatophilus sabuli]MBB3082755.1 pimeloyl-ACP methyl ester carboxylesterase [Geodermatophilus sabuli]SNX94379.1 Pimeloyl-ACP methyl ester carboxylesterase [Geodermatophilus sabuli]